MVVVEQNAAKAAKTMSLKFIFYNDKSYAKNCI